MSFANPMGFRCAPNACGPDYASEPDFRRFVAFGMLASHDQLLGPGCESIDADTNHVYWLRKQFLGELQIALDSLPEMMEEEGETVNYMGDHDDSAPIFHLKRDKWDGDSPDDNELVIRWCFDRLDKGEDACLLVSLTCTDADDYSIWLRLDAIKQDAAGIIQEAEAWNEANKGEETAPSY
jgi:hypothetical protein